MTRIPTDSDITGIPENRESRKKSPRVFESKELFGEGKLILIRHEDSFYRLMITRQGKLILNK